MGTHEPYWQTNSSFSPPPSRWDFRFQSEGISLGSHDSIQYGSSTSSNSRESRNWMRGNHFPSRQYVTSEGVGPYFSSPSDISPARQWTPPTTQDINIDDYGSSRRVLGPLSLSPTMEGTSAIQDSRGSTSSRSDSSDYEPMVKSHSSHHHFSSRGCFTSKLVHPVSFPSEIATREAADATATRLSEFEATNPQRERETVLAVVVESILMSKIFPSLWNLMFSVYRLTNLLVLNVDCVKSFFPRDHRGVLIEL